MRAVIVIASILAIASAHSWLGCSDYRGPADYFDQSKCYGYPRNWEQSRQGFLTPVDKGYQLGGDSGYNYQPGSSPCNKPFTSNVDEAYTKNFPKAVYEQGKTYCLAWPTKNHAAASCTNQYIPDTTMKIFRSGVNPTADPSQDDFKKNEVSTNFGTHSNGQVDCLGFQRSPKFCENTDKAMATGCIQVPADLAPGRYVYQWYWIFNPGSPYTTCWDVEVVAAGAGNGAGGLTSTDVADTLGSGGQTCKTNWAAQAFPTPTPSGGSATGGSGSAPDKPSDAPKPTLTGDSLLFTMAPDTIPQSGTFDVKVQYSAQGDRVIVVDILNLAGSVTWYGKGTASVATGTGEVTIKPAVSGTPPKASTYVLRAWMVSKTVYDDYVAELAKPTNQQDAVKAQPWTQEMDREDSALTVGDTLNYPANAASASAALSVAAAFVAVAAFAAQRRA